MKQLVVFIALMWGCWAAFEEDKITSLPGLNTPPSFNQYSGYLNASSTKLFHYWFVEAESSPEEAPLLIWLNGGPGCSSVLGLLTENGPFTPVYDGHYLMPNQYSWNKLANVLYIESPAGVGFSTDSSGRVATDDDEVAMNNFNALQDFMNKFPEYKSRPLFISGESYGGIYVPMFASAVAKSKLFNFKGFIVGNGCSDVAMNSNSILYFAYNHGLLSTGYFKALLGECCPNSGQFQCNFTRGAEGSDACKDRFNEGLNAIYSNGLNEYNMYADCLHDTNTFDITVDKDGYVTHHYMGLHSQKTDYVRKHKEKLAAVPLNRLRLDPPCLNSTLSVIYMNSPQVRTALHIPDSVQKWSPCSAAVNGQYKSLYPSMKPFFQNVLSDSSMRVLVYNGDVDMACNFLGDEWLVESFGLELTSTYHPWYYVDRLHGKQVAGYAHRFQGITFTTIRGAGHMVPTDKPQVGFEMMQKFLANEPI